MVGEVLVGLFSGQQRVTVLHHENQEAERRVDTVVVNTLKIVWVTTKGGEFLHHGIFKAMGAGQH